jgi:hypothetical protein
MIAAVGWLNTPVIRAIARAGASEASGGFRRFNATAVGRIPFPIAARDNPALVDLAEAGLHGASPGEDLDALATDLLGLDRHECRALHALA